MDYNSTTFERQILYFKNVSVSLWESSDSYNSISRELKRTLSRTYRNPHPWPQSCSERRKTTKKEWWLEQIKMMTFRYQITQGHFWSLCLQLFKWSWSGYALKKTLTHFSINSSRAQHVPPDTACCQAASWENKGILLFSRECLWDFSRFWRDSYCFKCWSVYCLVWPELTSMTARNTVNWAYYIMAAAASGGSSFSLVICCHVVSEVSVWQVASKDDF